MKKWIFTLLLAMAMLLSFSIAVFADEDGENEDAETVTIDKNFQTDGDDYGYSQAEVFYLVQTSAVKNGDNGEDEEIEDSDLYLQIVSPDYKDDNFYYFGKNEEGNGFLSDDDNYYRYRCYQELTLDGRNSDDYELDEDNEEDDLYPVVGVIFYAAGGANSALGITGEITYGDSDSNGSFVITLPDYEEVGTYTYTLQEVTGRSLGVGYDSRVITLVVEVAEKDENLIRSVSVTVEGGDDEDFDVVGTDEGEGNEGGTGTASGNEEIEAVKLDNGYGTGTLTIEKLLTDKYGEKYGHSNSDTTFTVTVIFTVPEGCYWDGTVIKTDGGVGDGELDKADWENSTRENGEGVRIFKTDNDGNGLLIGADSNEVGTIIKLEQLYDEDPYIASDTKTEYYSKYYCEFFLSENGSITFWNLPVGVEYEVFESAISSRNTYSFLSFELSGEDDANWRDGYESFWFESFYGNGTVNNHCEEYNAYQDISNKTSYTTMGGSIEEGGDNDLLVIKNYGDDSINITVEKIWAGDNNLTHPESITVQLLSGTNVIDTQTLPTEDGSWSFTWYNCNPHCVWSVSENTPEGYTSSIAEEEDKNSNITYTITNTLKKEETPKKINITVEKVWEDDDETYLEKSIEVKLLDGDTVFETVTLSEDSGWSYKWEGLKPDGDWDVVEEEVDGYTSSIAKKEDNDGNITYTITNTRVIDITVNKVWKDDDETHPDSITVQLMNGDEDYGEAVTLSADHDWSYTWEDLDPDGDWDVVEVEVDGYTSNIKEKVDDDGNITYTITNARVIEITVNKVWETNDETHPESIDVKLLNGTTVVYTQTLNEGNKWAYTWEDLASDGDWDVVEVEVEGYTAKYETNTNSDTGDITITITNTLDEDTPEEPDEPEEEPGGGDEPEDTPQDDEPQVTEVEEATTSTTAVAEVVAALTGDQANIALYAFAMIAALAGISLLVISIRRKKTE